MEDKKLQEIPDEIKKLLNNNELTDEALDRVSGGAEELEDWTIEELLIQYSQEELEGQFSVDTSAYRECVKALPKGQRNRYGLMYCINSNKTGSAKDRITLL